MVCSKFAVLILFLSLVISGAVQASIEKISLAGEFTTNPETGATEMRPLNPNGEVNLTFTDAGIQLQYADADGRTRKVQIVAAFPPLPPPTENPAQNLFNSLMDSELKNRGKVVLGAILRSTAQRLAQNGGTLILQFDRSARMGFVISDYDLHAVKVLGLGTPVLLSQALINVMSVEVKQQVAAISAPAAEPRRFPMGFLGDPAVQTMQIPTKAAATTLTCDALFTSAQAN